MRYRYANPPTRKVYPGLGTSSGVHVTSFVQKRRYRQRGIRIGRWFIPLGHWETW